MPGRLAVVAALAFAVAVVTGPANSFVFLYAQTVEHLAGWVTVLMVIAAGPPAWWGSWPGGGWRTTSAGALPALSGWR